MIKTIKVEAEANEMILENSFGDKVIIPADKRHWVKRKLGAGCHDCIDRLVSTLPTLSRYAQDGTVLPEDPDPNYGGTLPEVVLPAGKVTAQGWIQSYRDVVDRDKFIADKIAERQPLSWEEPVTRQRAEELYDTNLNNYVAAKLLNRSPRPEADADRLTWLNKFSPKERQILQASDQSDQLDPSPRQKFLNAAMYLNTSGTQFKAAGTTADEAADVSPTDLINYPSTVVSKIPQALYRGGYTMKQALEGRPNDASMAEDMATDFTTYASFGLGLAGKIGEAGKMAEILQRAKYGQPIARDLVAGLTDDEFKLLNHEVQNVPHDELKKIMTARQEVVNTDPAQLEHDIRDLNTRLANGEDVVNDLQQRQIAMRDYYGKKMQALAPEASQSATHLPSLQSSRESGEARSMYNTYATRVGNLQKLINTGAPSNDIAVLTQLTNEDKLVGDYIHAGKPQITDDHKFFAGDKLFKETKDLQPRIDALERIKKGLPANATNLRNEVNQQIADLHSTQWIRTNLKKEVQDIGRRGDMLDELSIHTDNRGTRFLTKKNGDLVGNLTWLSPHLGDFNVADAVLGEQYIGRGMEETIGYQNRLGHALYRGVSHGLKKAYGRHLESKGAFVGTELFGQTKKWAKEFWEKLVVGGYASKDAGGNYKVLRALPPFVAASLLDGEPLEDNQKQNQ